MATEHRVAFVPFAARGANRKDARSRVRTTDACPLDKVSCAKTIALNYRFVGNTPTCPKESPRSLQRRGLWFACFLRRWIGDGRLWMSVLLMTHAIAGPHKKFIAQFDVFGQFVMDGGIKIADRQDADDPIARDHGQMA